MFNKYEITGKKSRKEFGIGDICSLSCLRLRGPWQVRAFLNREYSKYSYGKFHTVYIPGGHLVEMQSLRNGEIKRVSDYWLRIAFDCVV